MISSKAGRREEEVELREGAPISALLEKLAENYGERLRSLFYVKTGAESILHPAFIVVVNGVLTNKLHGMKTELSDGDTVDLMMSVSGGQ